MLIDLAQRGSGKINDGLVEKPSVAAILQIAQRGLGEGNGSATTVDGLCEDFGLALGADFLGDLFAFASLWETFARARMC
jgi:hypothetical protein